MNRYTKTTLLAVVASLILGGISYACNLTPIADITTDPNNRCLGDTITFDGTSSYDPDGGNIEYYRWTFPETAYDISGTHTSTPSCKFKTAGSHEVRLKVLDDDGDWSVEDDATVTIVEIASLLPDIGAEIDDGEPNSRTFVVCTAGSGDVIVTATPNPDVSEANLPVCWSMSGGTGSGRLSRTVSLTSTGTTEIAVSTCGTSNAITIIDVSADSDSDGMPDDWETHFGLNPSSSGDAQSGLDGDGLVNLDEYLAGTDPNDTDTDHDGMDDDWEVDNSLDPLDPSDCDLDLDGDDHTNLGEYLHESDPNDVSSVPSANITIDVPDDVSIIQSAIYATIDGDVIELAQGTYYETINLAGKNITLQGSDPDDWDVVEATIIDANDLGPAVTFAGTEDPNCLLKGITITGGLGGYKDGLVAYWNMDDGSGSTASDGSGNSYDGALTNGPTWTSSGYLGGALSFDGTDDYVVTDGTSGTAYTGITGGNPRTVCAWIEATYSDNRVGSIVAWGEDDQGGERWLFALDTSGFIHLYAYAGGGVYGTQDLRDSQWHHVAAVLGENSLANVNEIRLYVDGILETVTTGTNYAVDTADNAYVHIGAHYRTDARCPFQGYIDEVRIYDRGLSDNEIAGLAGVGLAGHWRFDDSLQDEFGNNNGTWHDTNSSGCTYTDGLDAKALSFDGTDDCVEITSPSSVLNCSTITMSAWAKPVSSYSNGFIINRQMTNPGTYGLWVSYDKWNAVVKLSTSQICIVTSDEDVICNQWTHIAATYDGSELKLYINGVLKKTLADISGTIDQSNPGRLTIGSHPTYVSCFDGLIDDVRIYRTSLSENEIMDLYEHGGGVMGNGATGQISNCIIRDNYSVNSGGGVFFFDGTISRCVVKDNYAGYLGGGLANCDGTVINSVITENSAVYGGGLADCFGQIAGCVIAHNEADYGGGLDNCDAQIVNCTIIKNEASIASQGGGLRACDTTENASAEITNCIIYANLADGTKDQLSSCLSPTYSCTQDGSTSNGNIVDDPYFQEPDLADISTQTDISDLTGPDGLFGTNDDGYCLTAYSLCVDSGDNDSLDFDNDPNDDILLDLRGNTRKVDIPEVVDFGNGTSPIVDMGASEVQANDLLFPYTTTSFEDSEGFQWYNSIGTYDNWTVDAGTAMIELAYFYEDVYTPVAYQYLDISTNSTVTHEPNSSDQTSSYIGINCIPSIGAIIKVMDANDVVAAVKFHDTIDKIQVYDSDSLSYIDPSPSVAYQTIASQCRAFLDYPTTYCEDPNYAYSYENTWIQLEIRIDWSDHTYDVFWRHADNTPGALIEDNIPLNTAFDKFTKIVFENPSAEKALEINRLTFADEPTGGGQMGEDEGVWIVLPEADIENPLQGHCVVAGTIWYDGMGQYKIKCCPTDANTLDPRSWLVIADDVTPKKNTILGFWDTWGFRNGDYYLKIELCDELGYLLDTFDEVITKDISYKNSSNETITKQVNVAFPIIGRAKGKTYHYEERPDITVNWPGSFPFEFKRIYDDNLRGCLFPLFFGWTHNHNIRISEDVTRDWVTKTVGTEEVPDGDSNQLGIGRLWLQQALGSRMFLYDSTDSNKITYRPVDGENDYIIRTSTVDGSDFDVDYVHYATDGMKMTFDGITVTPSYTPATGQGLVDWSVQKGIERQEDRFGSALEYKWNNEISGRESQGEYYILVV
jgi:hypothetical protein